MDERDWKNELDGYQFVGDEAGEDIDELIKSTKRELEHNEQILNGKRPERPQEEEQNDPADEPELFTPKLPVEYADLTVEEEPVAAEPVKKKRLPSGVRALIYVVCVLIASAGIGYFAWICADDVLALTKENRTVVVTIAETDTFETVTQKLKESGLIEYPWLFRFYCWFSKSQDKMDPGTYELNNVYDYHALINGMIETSENRATETVTIPEGFECRQIFELLEQKGICSKEKLEQAAANYEFDFDFLLDLPYGDKNRLEGYLFPDTYEFYMGDEPENVLKKFLRNYNNKFTEDMEADIAALNETLAAHMRDSGFTEEEIQASMMDEHKIVIVASLIEKETASNSESATIGSVIYNRLCSKQYPLLQIDATIQYILEERKEELSAEDLAISSPYNTYKNPGLPAGPIANPGLNSIKAALYPQDTSYYFYALDEDGKHHFSTTYYEHQSFLEGQKNAQ